MLMKPAMSGGEAPPEKNDPGCWGDEEEGKGTKVVVVVSEGGGAAGFVSAETVMVTSPGNRLERGKEEEEDMAGGQGR